MFITCVSLQISLQLLQYSLLFEAFVIILCVFFGYTCLISIPQWLSLGCNHLSHTVVWSFYLRSYIFTMNFLAKIAIVCIIGGLTPFILAPLGVPPILMLGGIFCLSFTFGYLDRISWRLFPAVAGFISLCSSHHHDVHSYLLRRYCWRL